MSFRKEEKIILSYSEIDHLKKDLLKKGFKYLYPKRIIESIYFETIHNRCFNESEEGLLPRRKFRIRNYPEKNKNEHYNFEIKISSLEGRYKISKPIDKIINLKYLNSGIKDENYGYLEKKIKISYLREYLAFQDIRVTIDKNIEYFSMNSSRSFKEPMCVLEFKTDINHDDHLRSLVVSSSTNRFSKFCRGLKCINNISI